MHPVKKRRKIALPPLPDTFTDKKTLQASDSQKEKSSDKYEGRKRQIPHQEGNFPSFISVKSI